MMGAIGGMTGGGGGAFDPGQWTKAIGDVGSWFSQNPTNVSGNTSTNQAGWQEGTQTGTGSTISDTASEEHGTNTEQLQIDAAGVMKYVNDLMKDPNLGMAQVLGQEQSIGLYGGSQAAFNTNDLLDKIAGTVAQLTAKKVTTSNRTGFSRTIANTSSSVKNRTDFTNVNQGTNTQNSEKPGFISELFGGIRGIFKSDARLKSNVKQLGHTAGGVPWYEYDIEGRREQGVMAQELLLIDPTAVHVGEDGYLMVDYSKVH